MSTAASSRTERCHGNEQCRRAGGNGIGIAPTHLRHEPIRVAFFEFTLVTRIKPTLAIICNDFVNRRDLIVT